VLKRDGERGGERGTEQFVSAAERVGWIYSWSRVRRESDGGAQIVKIIHFFSVPHHANTREPKAQLYDRTELVQN
jgi:hypothetical protein